MQSLKILPGLSLVIDMAESCFNSNGFSWKKLRKIRRKTYNYKCPYTGRSCLSFDCERCDIKNRVFEYLKEFENEEDNY